MCARGRARESYSSIYIIPCLWVLWPRKSRGWNPFYVGIPIVWVWATSPVEFRLVVLQLCWQNILFSELMNCACPVKCRALAKFVFDSFCRRSLFLKKEHEWWVLLCSFFFLFLFVTGMYFIVQFVFGILELDLVAAAKLRSATAGLGLGWF